MPTPVLVHDYLLVLRGAERTFAAMTDVWPQAPIATLLYDEAGTAGRFAGRSVRTSRLQVLGAEQRNFRALLPLLPFAARRPAGRRPRRDRLEQQRVRPRRAQAPGVAAPLLLPLALPLRLARARPGPGRGPAAAAPGRWPPSCAATGPSTAAPPGGWTASWPTRSSPASGSAASGAATPSSSTRRSTSSASRRPSPASTCSSSASSSPTSAPTSRSRPRSRPAARSASSGRARSASGSRRASAGGRRSSGACPTRSSSASTPSAAALVVPNVEEFGIAAVEAQAAGRPVVAVDAGGVRETVVDGRTGVLVPPGDRDALVRALRGDFSRFDPDEIRRHAQRFSREAFQERLAAAVDEMIGRRGARRAG